MVGDFSTLFFVLGSLLMLAFGLNTFVSMESIRFHKTKTYIIATLCCRLIILTGYFSSVILSGYLLAKVMGIAFTGKDAVIFFQYSLYTMLFVILFYLLGVFLGMILRFRKIFFMSAYLAWFIVIFIVPLIHRMDLEKRAKEIKSNEIVNIKKLNNGKDFERKTGTFFVNLQEKKVKEIRTIARQFVQEYIEKILPLNTAIENNLNQEVKELINHCENQSVISPTCFYCFLAKEFSGMGYYGYQYFFKYILQLKKDFYRFYFDKRYNHIDQWVEPFVKDHRNIFRPRSLLPANFHKGLVLTLLYCLLLAVGTWYGLQRKRKGDNKKSENQRSPITLDIDQLEMGKTYFYLSRSRKQTDNIFNYLRSKGAAIIERVEPDLYDPGTSLRAWVEFEAKQMGVDAVNVFENLEILGVTGSQLGQKIKNLDNEVFSKAYLGLKLARDSFIYVFDDFLNRVSREFEQSFKAALDNLKPQAIILYFSSQMFDITLKDRHLPPHEDEKDFYARLVAVDLNDISLR